MSKTSDLGSSAARSTFFLGIGLLFGNAISSLFMFIIARILTPQGYGLYSVAGVPTSIAAIFRDWGIFTAAMHYIPYRRAKNEPYGGYVKATIFFEFMMGGSLFFSILLSANHIAILLGKPEAVNLIRISAVVIFTGGILAAFQGIMLGIEKPEYIASLVVIFSVIRGSLSVLFLIFGLGVYGALLGQIIGWLLHSFIALFITLLRVPWHNDNTTLYLKELLSYGIPYGLVTIASGLSIQLFNAIAASTLSFYDYGNYAAANILFTALNGVAGSVISGITPSFSKFAALTESINEASESFTTAVKFASIMICGIAGLFIGLASDLVNLFFGSAFMTTGVYVSMLIAILFLSAFGLYVISGVLLGFRKPKEVAGIGLIPLGFGLLFMIVTIETLGVFSFIGAIIVTYIGRTAIGYLWVHKKYGFRISITSQLKILFSGLITLILVKELALFMMRLSIFMLDGEILQLLVRISVSGIIGIGMYFLLIVFLRVLSKKEIDYLNSMLSKISIVRSFSKGLIRIMLKLAP